MDDLLEKIKPRAKQHTPHFLMLFGSRARATAGPESDWDFGYLADKGFDSDPLYLELVLLLKTDKVDLVDLSKANASLRFRATQDGKLIVENRSGTYFRFLFTLPSLESASP